MFFGDRLERGVKAADIVFCNPPFEADDSGDDLARVKKAAAILRRCATAAKPGAVFGFVVPQTMLDSHKLVDLRGSLVRDFEWLEICRLPDGIFEKADVETALLLGRRHPAGELKLTVGPTNFCHVLDADRYRTEFRESFVPTTTQPLPLTRVAPAPDHSLLVPDMLDVWDAMTELPKLSDVATVGQGFSFRSKKDPLFPKGETQVSPKPARGYAPGFFNADNLPESHLIPKLNFLNRNPDAILRQRSGYVAGKPQSLMGYHPASRGPWRNNAHVDLVGHPATSSFLLVRPNAGTVSELFLWALLVSPIANGFTASHFGKRNLIKGKVEEMRVPVPSKQQLLRIESAARAYREAAERWTKDHPQGTKPKSLNAESEDAAELDFFATEQAAEEQQLLALKYLHWRMDAEVLALYSLPAQLERQLLDYFTGEWRVGVPFEQTEYFPNDFKGINRLSELLTITADWPKHSKRRAFLITKEYEQGNLSAKDEAELESLQRLASLHRNYSAPIDRSELDASIKRLKLLGRWDE